VRIYHDILVGEDVDESSIDIVALNLIEFFERSLTNRIGIKGGGG
jgi:hypothetical protein